MRRLYQGTVRLEQHGPGKVIRFPVQRLDEDAHRRRSKQMSAWLVILCAIAVGLGVLFAWMRSR
jgi:hypothetical protein